GVGRGVVVGVGDPGQVALVVVHGHGLVTERVGDGGDVAERIVGERRGVGRRVATADVAPGAHLRHFAADGVVAVGGLVAEGVGGAGPVAAGVVGVGPHLPVRIGRRRDVTGVGGVRVGVGHGPGARGARERCRGPGQVAVGVVGVGGRGAERVGDGQDVA